MAIAWRSIRALTFDCYGTLVDWESGIARDLRAGLDPTLRVGDEQLLRWYAEAETGSEGGPFRSYREVLREALEGVGRRAGVAVRNPEALVAGLERWPLFADTSKALQRLKRHFLLCVVSNVDRDLFARTEKQLGVVLDQVVTADEVRSFKPASPHFEEAIRRLGAPHDSIVHVAQSLHHDILPASVLGLATVWVDRRAGRPGGATPPVEREARPDLRVTSLAELADLVERALT